MKFTKWILAMILVVTMAAGGLVTASAATSACSYSDCPYGNECTGQHLHHNGAGSARTGAGHNSGSGHRGGHHR